MRVLASSWRYLLAAVVVAAWTLAMSVNAGSADSEESDVARERKAESERVERDRPPAEGEKAERETQVRKLKERAEQIQRELREVRPDQGERAEKLEREMREIRGRLQELGRPDRPEPERERLMHRIKELKDAMVRAREAGQRDEVGRLEREVQELMRILQGGPKRPDEPGREEARRLQHLRQAIGNLRAGGFHDLAERLQREIEPRTRDAGPESPRAPHPELRDRPWPEMPHGPPPPELERAVHELRAEVRQLQHQMEEMREHLKRVLQERHGEKK
ncbi:MAG: hypothetical protein RBS80_18280 [Thermoguttaceae bacterium]|nr:hypothetical protein [Thermoguttaceae bacterium]